MRLALFFVWIVLCVSAACSLVKPAAANDDPPITLAHPVVFEAPYRLGERPSLKSKDQAKEEEAALARWNVGGRDGTWHPHPRVIVDNVRVQGKVSSAAVLRAARAQGYWQIRRCYDPALPDKPELRGKLTVRFTLRNSGTAVRSSVVGKPTLDDRKVVACLRDAFRTVKFPRTGRGDATVSLDVTVHPGDAPMKAVEDPPVTRGPGAIDLPAVQAVVARHAGVQIQECYAQAARRVPGLWGRLVLRLDVAPNGGIRHIVETDSTFPDPQTTRCAVKAIQPIGLPAPQGGDVRIVLPIRFGHPR